MISLLKIRKYEITFNSLGMSNEYFLYCDNNKQSFESVLKLTGSGSDKRGNIFLSLKIWLHKLTKKSELYENFLLYELFGQQMFLYGVFLYI